MHRWGPVLGLLACTWIPKPDEEGPDVDESDADVDSDSDGDSDADIVMTGLIHKLSGYEVVEPVPSALVADCDASYTLTATTYTGDCPGCDFAFTVTSTPDDVVVPCTDMLFTPDDSRLAFAPSYVGVNDTYINALLVSAGDETSWTLLRADGIDPDEVFTFDGATLHWSDEDSVSFNYGYGTYIDTYGAACPGFTSDDFFIPAAHIIGDASAIGTIPCGQAARGDVYELSLSAYDTVEYSLDTLAAETSFDPRVSVLAPDGCIIAYGEENVACTYPPPTGYLCPAGTFVAPVTGLYQLTVSTYPNNPSSCASGIVDYDLRVAVTPTPLTALPVRLDDELLFSDYRTATTRYDLTITLTK